MFYEAGGSPPVTKNKQKKTAVSFYTYSPTGWNTRLVSRQSREYQILKKMST